MTVLNVRAGWRELDVASMNLQERRPHGPSCLPDGVRCRRILNNTGSQGEVCGTIITTATG